MVKIKLTLSAALAVLIVVGAVPQKSAKAPTIGIQLAVAYSIKPV